jgi:putative membrane protein insertion efficiency factor
MKLVVLAALRLYRRLLSPLLPPACRYVPSCSEYALEAVERHGAWRGAALAVARVLKCHPLARGGYDPVPRPFDSLHPCAHDADGLAR